MSDHQRRAAQVLSEDTEDADLLEHGTHSFDDSSAASFVERPWLVSPPRAALLSRAKALITGWRHPSEEQRKLMSEYFHIY